jgi:5-methylcytosine-specific restriction enzyme A
MPDSPSPKKRPWLTGSGFARGRKSQNSKFYESTAWRKLRGMFIRANPVCVECGRVGAVVDHIVRVNDDSSRALDWSNLQTMCHPCHNAKSGREAHNRDAK